MPTQTTNYGVVRFMPVETFQDPNRGLDRDSRTDWIFDSFTEGGPIRQSTGDWPRIHTAIRRGDLFVIETSTPTFKALLRFSPSRLDIGDYQIHHLPHGGTEAGRTVKVTPVETDETDYRISMLTPFAERFMVVTLGNERPHLRMMWLVGLSSYRVVNETAETKDDAA